MATVTLNNVQKHYGDVHVIQGVDLAIKDREFVVFVGPSGCGKSTLLRMIAGLEEITGGELKIDGSVANDVPPDQRGLAMVFQSYALYPHMSVANNMAFALKLAGVPKTERDAKVSEAARILSSRSCSTAGLVSFRAASASASPSAAPSCVSPRCFCSTSPCRTSMPRCACRCASKSRACTTNSTPR